MSSVCATFAVHGRFPYQIRAQLYSSLFTYELYQKETIIPATNAHAKTRTLAWTDFDLDEFLNLMGILLSMEVYKIHGPRRMYWNKEGKTFFLL